MVRGRKTKGMVALCLLIIASLINAAQKTSRYDGAFTSYFPSSNPDVYTQSGFETGQTAELYNCLPRTAGEEFHKQSVSFTVSPGSPIHDKLLPTVLSAPFIIPAGFCRVSLVNDWKVRQAGLMSFLRAAESGFCFPPKRSLQLRGYERINELDADSICRSDKPFYFLPAFFAKLIRGPPCFM